MPTKKSKQTAIRTPVWFNLKKYEGTNALKPESGISISVSGVPVGATMTGGFWDLPHSPIGDEIHGEPLAELRVDPLKISREVSQFWANELDQPVQAVSRDFAVVRSMTIAELCRQRLGIPRKLGVQSEKYLLKTFNDRSHNGSCKILDG